MPGTEHPTMALCLWPQSQQGALCPPENVRMCEGWLPHGWEVGQVFDPHRENHKKTSWPEPSSEGYS